ncbi:MAG TPA: PilN domain-containing protein [Pilimelia sp.]|nr:PilN domain-containing protein [Pilimelia sp.]
MSSTHVARGTAVVGQPYPDPRRIPPIAADLLPLEIRDARSNRRRRRQVVAALIGTVALVGAAYAGLFTLSAAAELMESRVRDDITAVKQQQEQYAPLVQAQSETAALNGKLAALMAQDAHWGPLLREVSQAAPAGMKITNFEGQLPAAAAADRGAAAQPGAAVTLPGGGNETVVGTLEVQGTAARKADVATLMDTLEASRTVDRPVVKSVEADGSRVAFTLAMDLTAATLDDEYRKRTEGGN